MPYSTSITWYSSPFIVRYAFALTSGAAHLAYTTILFAGIVVFSKSNFTVHVGSAYHPANTYSLATLDGFLGAEISYVDFVNGASYLTDLVSTTSSPLW